MSTFPSSNILFSVHSCDQMNHAARTTLLQPEDCLNAVEADDRHYVLAASALVSHRGGVSFGFRLSELDLSLTQTVQPKQIARCKNPYLAMNDKHNNKPRKT